MADTKRLLMQYPTMNNKIYTYTMARVYDILNCDIDYGAWAEFAERCMEKYSDIPVKSVCEVACGTGSLAIKLAQKYSVTACDFSEDMLTEAESKARGKGLDIRFVLQDMRSTSMFSKKDCFLCMLDGINYLTSRQDVISAFGSIYDNLNDGGIFIFDINSKYKFQNIYADNQYVLEDEGIYCGWQNYYNEKSRMCDFYLTFFSEQPDGSYIRSDEVQREKMYTVKQIKSYLVQAGFETACVCGGFDFCDADENTQERIFFVAKKAKN